MRLYFLHVPGCHACESAMPPMRRWEKKHPDVKVVYVDLTKANWTHPWSPEVTPTYVLEMPGYQRARHDGMLDEKQIDQWLGKAQQAIGAAR